MNLFRANKALTFFSVIVAVCGCICLCCLICKRTKRNRNYEAFAHTSNTPKEELELDDKEAAKKVLQSEYHQLPTDENVYDELPTTL